jgi:MFS family permease
MRSPNKWIVLIAAFAAYMFDALEIIILSLALPAIRADMHLSVAQGGLLATATLLGIGVSSTAMGWLADNYGRKTALLLSLAVFGLFTALLFVVPNFGMFLVLRFAAGFGLGGVWGVVSAYVVETWPKAQRGRAAAFVLSSFPAGGVLAALAAGLILPNWRLLFLVAGTGAVVPLVLVGLLVRESAEWAEQKGAPVRAAEVFAPGLRRRTLLGTAVAALALCGWWGGTTWLPTYLHTERGIPTSTVSVFLIVLNAGMFVGYNVFGLIADRIGRKNALIVSLAGVAATLPLYAVTANQTALLWLGPLFAFFASFTGIFGSYLGELFPTRVRATGAGFCFNVGRGISAFAPFVLGAMATSTGLGTGLVISGGLFLCSAIVMTLLPNLRKSTALAVAAA